MNQVDMDNKRSLNNQSDISRGSNPLKPSQGYNKAGVMTLIGGFLIHTVLGCLYLWGNISGYVISYFHYNGVPDIQNTAAIQVIPITFTIQSLVLPFGTYLQKRYPIKIVLLLGIAICCVSVFSASLVQTWWQFLIVYAVMYPIGMALTYFAPITCGWEYFPNNRGFVVGLVLCGFGLGAFFFGFLSSALVKTGDMKKVQVNGQKYFKEEVASNVPHMFQVLTIVYGIIAATGISMVSRNPEVVQKEKQALMSDDKKTDTEYNPSINLVESHQVHIDGEQARIITVSDAVRTVRFWKLTSMLYFGIFYGVFMASVYKEIPEELEDDIKTWAGGLGSICNGCSRLFWASMQDKYGFRKVYGCVLVIQFTASLLLYPLKEQGLLFTGCICLSFLCEGAHFACFPAACAQIFGSANGATIASFAVMAVPLSSLSSLAAVYLLKGIIDYHAIFLVATVFTFINMVINYGFDDTEMVLPKNSQSDEF